VVYVGFGTITIISPQCITQIIHALLVAHKKDCLMMWLPKTITVDDIAHSIGDMRLDKHPVIHLLNCASQQAILQHPSTKLFITRCGMSSVHETLHTGVPIIGISAFIDQPGDAIELAEQGVGLWLPKLQVNEETLDKMLYRLLSDNSNKKKFLFNAARLKKIV
ncbi:hypothetical protein BDF19DRAFT_336240, partial [Syncephalis fuscata]